MAEKWMKQARRYQQENCNLLGDRTWDLLEDEDHVKLKIGFALFGINTFDSCSQEDSNLKTINAIKDHIILLNRTNAESGNISKSIHLACIHIYLYLDSKKEAGVDTLFRILKNEHTQEYQFVDRNCRTYDGWNDYLKNNKLPKCRMCYPSEGIYSVENGSVKIDFGKSAACRRLNRILDVTSKIVTIGAKPVSIASLALPIAAPFELGANIACFTLNAYGIGQSIATLIDKKNHKESVSLKNSDSRSAWIDLAASTLSIVSLGGSAVAKKIIKTPVNENRNVVTALGILRCSAAVVNGFGVLNCLFTIVTKFLNGTLTTSDFKFVKDACFYFLNAIISYELAAQLIEDAVVSGYTNLFHVGTLSYQVVKSFSSFDMNTYSQLKQMVFGALSYLMPDTSRTLSDFSVHMENLITLPLKLKNGTISLDKFLLELQSSLQFIWTKSKTSLRKCVFYLCKVFQRDWSEYTVGVVNKPFYGSSPEHARQFCMIIQNTIQHCRLDDDHRDEYFKDILSLIEKFFDNFPGILNTDDFLEKSMFICYYLMKDFDSLAENGGYKFDSYKFNFEEGTSSNHLSNLKSLNPRVVFKHALNEIDIKKLSREYKLPSKCLDFTQQRLANNNPSLYETQTTRLYAFSGPVGCQVLTEQYYWQEACCRTEKVLNKDNSLLISRHGIVLIKPIQPKSFGINTIVFYNSYEEDCVMGIMSVIKNVE